MKLGISLAGYPWAPNPDGWSEHKDWIAKHCDTVGLPMPYWGQLEPVPGVWQPSALNDLDTVVMEARQLGLRILLYMTGWPAWASAKHRAARGGKSRVSPDNLTDSGPWARYLRIVLAHYAGMVDWVAPLNEVNFAFMDDPTTMARDTATLMRTAANVAKSILNRPMLLMPAVLDADIGGQSNWRTFTEAVLTDLTGWKPPAGVQVGWAHHPYTDVHEGVPKRTQGSLDLLEKHGWHDGRRIYLPELGFQFDARPVAPGSNSYVYSDPRQLQTQSDHLGYLYAWATNRAAPKINGEIVMAQQWVMQDTGWGHWQSGLLSPDGTSHPVVPFWELARNK